MKQLLLLLLILPSFLAYAEDSPWNFSVGVLGSYHPNEEPEDDYDSVHGAVFLEHESGWGLFGLTNNSHGDPTLSVGYTFEHSFTKNISVELYLGVIWGYKDNLKLDLFGEENLDGYGWFGVNYDFESPWSLELKALGTEAYALGLFYEF